MQDLSRFNKVILGTAQLGLKYGPKKAEYEVTQKRAFDILSNAFGVGVRCLDTATGYGESHQFIGDFHRANENMKFNIFTKVTSSEYLLNKNLINELLVSLNVNEIAGVLLHKPEDISHIGFLDYLKNEKAKGRIQKVGVSLYYDESFYDVINVLQPDFVQLPLNAIDNARLRKENLEFLNKRGIGIQVRSCFLRGAVSSGEYPKGLESAMSEIRKICKTEKRAVIDLFLNYILSLNNIQSVVLGVDDESQLHEIQLMSVNPLKPETIYEIEKVSVEDVQLLDLRKW